MKIGFFLESFPVFSETFVSNELFQLQPHVKGVIWRETTGGKRQQPINQKIIFPVQTIIAKITTATNLRKIIGAHWYWMTKKPIQYWSLWKCFVSFSSLDNLKIFIKAPLVAQQVEKEQCTLLYVHESDRAFLYALAAKLLCNIPLGIIFHSYYLFYKNQYLGKKMQLADFVLFQSEYSLQYAKQHTALKSYAHCHVVSSPGIDTDFFTPSTTKHARKKLELVSIGRLEKMKGFELLVQAIAILKERKRNAHLTIVGYGSLEKQLKQLIKQKKLQSNVALAGPIEHSKKLLQLLNKAEIFVLPSVIDQRGVRDMQPNAVKEAMAMGLLVITTRLGGIEEVIKNGKNGFLINKPTPAKIAEKIADVHTLPISTKKQIKKKARETILKQFDQTYITQQLLHVFSKHEKLN